MTGKDQVGWSDSGVVGGRSIVGVSIIVVRAGSRIGENWSWLAVWGLKISEVPIGCTWPVAVHQVQRLYA